MSTITITPAQKFIRLRVEDVIVAASSKALILQESKLPEVIYFPAENLLTSAHLPTSRHTHCPYKGDAAYFSVGPHENKAWVYYDPIDSVSAIAGYVAYYGNIGTFEELTPPPLPNEARSVLEFWFKELSAEQHYKQDDDVDTLIRERFGALHQKAAAGQLNDWAMQPEGLLALIILLDQFSRNLYRNDAQAFAQDEAARQHTQQAVEQGFDLALTATQRAFIYMPLMHSETLADQNQCVRLFETRLPGAINIAYAHSHRQDIHRYGRFPYRDQALGRGE